jgi:hypothetical protein
MDDQIQKPGAQSAHHHSEDQSWLVELPMLLSRHSGLGIGSDVFHMSAPELHGLYHFLTRRHLSQAPDVDKF